MNRLIQMTGMVPVILSVFCACQHPAPQAAGTVSYTHLTLPTT